MLGTRTPWRAHRSRGWLRGAGSPPALLSTTTATGTHRYCLTRRHEELLQTTWLPPTSPQLPNWQGFRAHGSRGTGAAESFLTVSPRITSAFRRRQLTAVLAGVLTQATSFSRSGWKEVEREMLTKLELLSLSNGPVPSSSGSSGSSSQPPGGAALFRRELLQLCPGLTQTCGPTVLYLPTLHLLWGWMPRSMRLPWRTLALLRPETRRQARSPSGQFCAACCKETKHRLCREPAVTGFRPHQNPAQLRPHAIPAELPP